MTLLGSFEEAAMNDKTAGNRGPRRAGALAFVAVVAVLATACSVQTYISYPASSAGSATYRQEIAFVRCMRSHGVPNLPDPSGRLHYRAGATKRSRGEARRPCGAGC